MKYGCLELWIIVIHEVIYHSLVDHPTFDQNIIIHSKRLITSYSKPSACLDSIISLTKLVEWKLILEWTVVKHLYWGGSGHYLFHSLKTLLYMLTSRHGNNFHITGPLWEQSTVMSSFDAFLLLAPTSYWMNSQIIGNLRCHYSYMTSLFSINEVLLIRALVLE